MNSTKKGEHYRTLELFKNILDKQGLAMALFFLHDSQCNIKLLAEIELKGV